MDVMVDLGRHLGGEEEEAVGREDQDSILCLVAAFFQLHRCLEQDLNRVEQNCLTAQNRIKNTNLLTEYRHKFKVSSDFQKSMKLTIFYPLKNKSIRSMCILLGLKNLLVVSFTV